MKNVKKVCVKNPENNTIIRINEFDADILVRENGFKYVPKSAYKSYIRRMTKLVNNLDRIHFMKAKGKQFQKAKDGLGNTYMRMFVGNRIDSKFSNGFDGVLKVNR